VWVSIEVRSEQVLLSLLCEKQNIDTTAYIVVVETSNPTIHPLLRHRNQMLIYLYLGLTVLWQYFDVDVLCVLPILVSPLRWTSVWLQATRIF